MQHLPTQVTGTNNATPDTYYADKYHSNIQILALYSITFTSLLRHYHSTFSKKKLSTQISAFLYTYNSFPKSLKKQQLPTMAGPPLRDWAPAPDSFFWRTRRSMVGVKNGRPLPLPPREYLRFTGERVSARNQLANAPLRGSWGTTRSHPLVGGTPGYKFGLCAQFAAKMR